MKEQLIELPLYEQTDSYLKCKVVFKPKHFNLTVTEQLVETIKNYGDQSVEEGCKIFRDYNRKQS